MSFVGLDIDKCVELKAHLDQACQDLNAHADRVQALLNQARITSCKAPAEIREIAAWADWRARDLQKRIDKARAIDSGSAWGSRFGGNRAAASEAGVREAEKIKDLLSHVPPDQTAIEKELKKAKAYADDPAYATALIHRLGSDKLVSLLQGWDNADMLHPPLSHEALGVLAALLASVSQNKPNDKVLNDLVAKASPAELGALLGFEGYGSKFTADAARVVLRAYPPAAASFAMDGGKAAEYRHAALQALADDPKAAFLFLTEGKQKDQDAPLRTLMANGDRDGGKLAAWVLKEGLLEFPYGPNGKDADRTAADKAMDRAITLVDKGTDVSGPAKQALAAAFAPRFADGPGRVPDMAMNYPKDSAEYTRLQTFLTALMKDDGARAILADEASGWIAGRLNQGLDGAQGPGKEFEFNGPATDIASVLNLMNKAANAVIDSKVEQAKFVAGIVKSAASLGVDAVAAPLGPVAVGGANFVVGHGIDKISDEDIQQMLKDKNTLGRDADVSIQVRIAQYLIDHPDPRAPVVVQPKDSPYHPPVGPDGRLRVPTTREETEAFNHWFNSRDGAGGSFRSLVLEYQGKVSDDLAKRITLGE